MTVTIKRVRAVQLAVVLLIIVVLAGLMLSRSLRIRDGAREASAKSLARNALTLQRSHYYGTGEYADAAELHAGDDKMDTTEDVAVQGKVFVRSEGHTTTLASSSKDGTCYWIRDTAGVATYAVTPCDEEPDDADFTASW